MYQQVRNPTIPRTNSGYCGIFLFSILLIFSIWSCVFIYKTPDLYQHFPFFESSPTITPGAIAFQQFVTDYNKEYKTPEETAERQKIFEENYRLIEEYNSQIDRTATLGINKFADLTEEEFTKRHLPKSVQPEPAQDNAIFRKIDPNLTVNWNKEGKVAPVKDQGNCGSCWTFSSISVVETLWAIRRGKSPDRLSEQQLVDCCRTKDSNGCHGGEEHEALGYIRDKGIAFEKDYPYHARDEECKETKVPAQIKIANFAKIQKGNNSEMERVVKTRSLSVALYASAFVFRFYKSGVVAKGCPSDELNHAVTVVGAGLEGGIPYWLVRNSWGLNWGDKGHIKIARSEDGLPGVCGISSSVHYPLYQEPK